MRLLLGKRKTVHIRIPTIDGPEESVLQWAAQPPVPACCSGAQYFEFSLGWVCARTGTSLLDAMRRDLAEATGRPPPELSWPEGSRALKPQADDQSSL